MFERFTRPPSEDQLVALAGLFQACAQVDSLARLGAGSSRALETAVRSLLARNPESALAVYGGIECLEGGFAALEEILLDHGAGQRGLVLHYVLGALHLGRKLARDRAMLERVDQGLGRVERQVALFGPTHANVVANVADLYQQTLSTYRFRIQVQGTAAHLRQPGIADRIRCLLFSAVRSAILWRQVGGRRSQLILGRNRLLPLARELHGRARQAALERDS